MFERVRRILGWERGEEEEHPEQAAVNERVTGLEARLKRLDARIDSRRADTDAGLRAERAAVNDRINAR